MPGAATIRDGYHPENSQDCRGPRRVRGCWTMAPGLRPDYTRRYWDRLQLPCLPDGHSSQPRPSRPQPTKTTSSNSSSFCRVIAILKVPVWPIETTPRQAYNADTSLQPEPQMPPAGTNRDSCRPIQQQRLPTDVDLPPRPALNVYCRCPRTRRVQRPWRPQHPLLQQARQTRPDAQFANATRITSRSTTATTGRATPNTATTSRSSRPAIATPGTPIPPALPPAARWR